MPNNITNNLHITGKKAVLEELQACHINDECMDFHTIIPRPASMNIISGSYVKECADYLKQYPGELKEIKAISDLKDARFKALLTGNGPFSNIIKREKNLKALIKVFEMGNTYNQNLDKYGHQDWYSWSIANWDTKWNAYEGAVSMNNNELLITFDTAWSQPTSVIVELASLYPEVKIRHCYIDEGGGFAGTTHYAKSNWIKDIDENTEFEGTFAQEEFGWQPY